MKLNLFSFCMSLISSTLLFLLPTPKAQAYDVDTHFYGTYIIARYAGIGPEVAGILATGAQWVDETMITTAMGLSRQRGIYHFAGSARDNRVTKSHGAPNLLFNVLTIAEPNHALGSQLIHEGMRAGNIWTVAAGIHVLQDTFGHAGFTSALGHAEDGHDPDRPYLYPEKYKAMTKEIFVAMVAIRRLLPDVGLDKSFQDRTAKRAGSGINNWQMDAETLAENFFNRQEVNQNILRNIFANKEYAYKAGLFIYKQMKSVGYLLPHVDENSIVPETYFNGQVKAQDALLNITRGLVMSEVAHLQEQVTLKQEGQIDEVQFKNLNLGAIKEDVFEGFPIKFANGDPEEFVRSWEQLPQRYREEFFNKFVDRVTFGYLPQQRDAYHKFLMELDSPVRELEKTIRIGNMQKLITELFGDHKIKFESQKIVEKVQQSLKDIKTKFLAKFGHKQSKKEVLNRQADKEKLYKGNPLEEGAIIISMPRKERVKWNLQHIPRVLGLLGTEGWFQGVKRGESSEEARYYQVPELFEEMIASGKYPEQVITAEEVLAYRKEKMRAQSAIAENGKVADSIEKEKLFRSFSEDMGNKSCRMLFGK